MKKLLLIALLIVGCDNSTEPSYTTRYLDWTGGINTCTEELTERECYEYQEWTIVDSDGKENQPVDLSTWSATSSCSELGFTEIIDLCIESNEILSDTTHCNLTWYCSGSCDSLLVEVAIVQSMAGCMLQDEPNYDASALIPCTTDCVNGQTGSNCCCE